MRAESGCGAGLLDVDAALALAAAQSECGERCGDNQLCSAGRCVAADGAATAGGCQLAGARGGGASSLWIAWIALMLVGAARQRSSAGR